MVDVVGTASAVLALVGAAETAVTTFATFCRGVGGIENTISDFLQEVQTLLRLITAIKETLDELPPTLRQDRALKVIWGPMESSLSDCIPAVEDLTSLFQDLNQSTGGWLRNAIAQIRLQFQEPEIARLRKRIASLRGTFDTAMGVMTFFTVLDKKLEQSKIERSLDNLVDKYDSHKDLMAKRRATRIEGSNLSTAEIQEENMLKAVKSIIKSADETIDRLSTVGSEIDTQTEETETRDDVADWRERLFEAEIPPTILEEEPMDSITWPEDTKRSQPLNKISLDNMKIRSHLFAEGITAYSRSNYVLANSCFKDAYETVGPINAISLLDGQVSDDTVKAWLWLSEIRVNARKSKWDKVPPANSGLTAPNVNTAAIRIESRIQTCCDAVTLSLAFMHRGDTGKAHDLCEAAMARIKELKDNACKEYAAALLALVEIVYSKGSAPLAKYWRDDLLKNHKETLRENVTRFFLQDFPPWPGPWDDLFVGLNISNRLGADTPNEAHRDAKDCLCNAIEYGNFPAALFVISTFDVSLLKIPRLVDEYLVNSVKSDSASIVFLLTQFYPELEKISGLQYPTTTRETIDRVLREAASYDFSAAIELLIDAGANKDKSERRCSGDAREEPCYPVDSRDTKTSVLSHAISKGNRKAVNTLLDRGAVLNGPLTVRESYDSHSVCNIEPPLHVAIRRFEGRQMVPLLLERGADVNCAFRDVRPLALAIYHSGKPRDELSVSSTDERIVARSTVVELLLEKGADVNRRSLINGVRVTPLQQAHQQGLMSIERFLLAKGAVERSEPRVPSRRQVQERTTRTRGERLLFGGWADD